MFRDVFARVGRINNKELTDAEAEKLMEQLRQEKDGILRWVVEGCVLAAQDG